MDRQLAKFHWRQKLQTTSITRLNLFKALSLATLLIRENWSVSLDILPIIFDRDLDLTCYVFPVFLYEFMYFFLMSQSKNKCHLRIEC